MRTFRNRVCSLHLIGPAIAALLIAMSLLPGLVTAHGDGEHVDATIANANGDNVLLRSRPGYDESEIDRFAEGTMVEVTEGPFSDDQGNFWYQILVEGQSGFMVSDYLVADTGFARTSGRATANDSVFVRSGPSGADRVVATLAQGESVTLTGGSQLGWVSVSAAASDGWVFNEFLTAIELLPVVDDIPAPSSGETRWTLEQVNLRSGPGTEYDAIATLPAGVQLSLAGDIQGQFALVTSAYGDGWVYTQVIGPNAPANPVTPEVTTTPEPETPEPEPTAVPTEEPGVTGTRWTQEQVFLRSGPSTESSSTSYLDAGVQLELTGEISNGFAQVTSPFGPGWVFAQYIAPTPPDETQTPTPTPEPETSTPEPQTPESSEPVARYATANVNLRAEASDASTAIVVIALGTEVQFAGLTANGFSQVTTGTGVGWIASEYLSETQPEEPEEPEPSGSLIAWPVRGGEWNMLQGYNGSSHQNRSSSWQYLYSLDLQRSDGDTAGQPVYSPVDGTIRWIDEAFGGGSIFMGDGLAFAWFHTVIDPSIQEGDAVTQGQYLGTVAPAGQFGAGSNPHLHITMWETDDGGNFSRRAIPFTGQFAIAGIEFPINGSSNQWRGTTFFP